MSEPWSEERVALLRTMKAQGQSHTRIAKAVSMLPGPKITRNAVGAKCDRLGLRIGIPQVRPQRKVKLPVIPVERKPFVPREIGARENPILHAERGRFECAYPVSGEGVELMVCGRLATRGPYCAECAAVAYIPRPVKAA